MATNLAIFEPDGPEKHFLIPEVWQGHKDNGAVLQKHFHCWRNSNNGYH